MHFITRAHHSGSAWWLKDIEVGSRPIPHKSSAGAQMKIHCGFDIWGSETIEFLLFILYAKGRGRKGERQSGGRGSEVGWFCA